MSLFFRKSLKLGPVRFNLSKSGVGVSAGVKGLRVGTTARGSSYVSGGRGGIYFRRNLAPGSATGQEGRPTKKGYILPIAVAVIGGLFLLAGITDGGSVRTAIGVILGVTAFTIFLMRRTDRTVSDAASEGEEPDEEKPNPYREGYRAEVRLEPDGVARVGTRTLDVPTACVADASVPNGVRVEIGGAPVGHLPEDAAQWVLALGRAHECRGRIFGRTLILDIPPTGAAPSTPAPSSEARSSAPPISDDHDALRARLTELVTSGQSVRIIYRGGSQPGSVREIRPLAVLATALHAHDVAAGADKHFLLAKLELADEQSAAPVYDPAVRTERLQSARSNPDPAFPLDVWGESEYQDALERICGGRTAEGADTIVPARVVPHDQDNYDDPMGVSVEIHGQVVGNLSNLLMWRYRTKTVGPTDCRARIVGGWDRGPNDRGHFGVKLDLDLGDTDGPLRPERIVPFWEHPCEIIGEAQHQAALRDIVASSARDGRTSPDGAARCQSRARLVREGEAVRVEIDGQPVGRLNPAKARRYLQLKDPPTEARAFIQGGELSWDEKRRSPYSVTLHLYLLGR